MYCPGCPGGFISFCLPNITSLLLPFLTTMNYPRRLGRDPLDFPLIYHHATIGNRTSGTLGLSPWYILKPFIALGNTLEPDHKNRYRSSNKLTPTLLLLLMPQWSEDTNIPEIHKCC